VIPLVLITLVGLVLLGPPLFFGPRLLRAKATETAQARLVPIPEANFPPELKTRRDEVGQQLQTLGFVPWGQAHGQNLPGAPTLIGWRLPEAPTVAVLAFTRRSPERGTFSLGFESGLESGERLITRNLPSPRPMPAVSGFDVEHWPGATTPEALWAVHQRRLGRAGPLAAAGPIEPMEQALAQARDRLLAAYQQRGLYEIDGERLRLTRAGSWRLAWGSTPPFRELLRLAQWFGRA
jgi:hypothetical protein